jgi:hypothetical protein
LRRKQPRSSAVRRAARSARPRRRAPFLGHQFDPTSKFGSCSRAGLRPSRSELVIARRASQWGMVVIFAAGYELLASSPGAAWRPTCDTPIIRMSTASFPAAACRRTGRVGSPASYPASASSAPRPATITTRAADRRTSILVPEMGWAFGSASRRSVRTNRIVATMSRTMPTTIRARPW